MSPALLYQKVGYIPFIIYNLDLFIPYWLQRHKGTALLLKVHKTNEMFFLFTLEKGKYP